jgi:hypothetical protein
MLSHAQWTEGPTDDSPPVRWTAGQCPHCRDAVLYVQEYFGERQFPPDGWDDYHRVYPPQPRRLSREVPRRLREDHAEAVQCIEGRTYKAAAVMARRIVEGITEDKGYTSGDLFSRLKTMKKDGVIDARLYDWADICRDVGNQGAHASKTAVDHRDAEEALEFAEALLDYLYVFQDKYEEFKKRRDKAKSRAKSRSKATSTA